MHLASIQMGEWITKIFHLHYCVQQDYLEFTLGSDLFRPGLPLRDHRAAWRLNCWNKAFVFFLHFLAKAMKTKPTEG